MSPRPALQPEVARALTTRSTPSKPPGAVWVMGAGSLGCFIGGSLQAAGVPVHFIGRPRVLSALRATGLTLTDLDGRRVHLAPQQLSLADAPSRSDARPSPALVLLCVKSGSTREVAASLDAVLEPRTLLLSLQNGVSNASVAQQAAPSMRALAGVVSFNVAEQGPGHFHRGTSGQLAAARHGALEAWLPWFERAHLPLALHTDMQSVQWAKLLLNLNNAVNALSGLPLREQLLERGYRRVLAGLQAEALAVLDAADIVPAKLTPVPVHWLPTVLRLPTPLFKRVAARMLRVDASARSSMADDLRRDRPTEIDALCGEVVRLATRVGSEAPANARIAALVRTWPQRRQPYGPLELLRALGL
ncbi:MAG: 2-dehydropantoate 2-reductase [Aquincola sp.]|nr:2-dehydropantoate 2-reductase [Aquincola sp.]